MPVRLTSGRAPRPTDRHFSREKRECFEQYGRPLCLRHQHSGLDPDRSVAVPASPKPGKSSSQIGHARMRTQVVERTFAASRTLQEPSVSQESPVERSSRSHSDRHTLVARPLGTGGTQQRMTFIIAPTMDTVNSPQRSNRTREIPAITHVFEFCRNPFAKVTKKGVAVACGRQPLQPMKTSSDPVQL